MSERDYLISKADRTLAEERKEAARQTRKDPAFLAATGGGLAATGVGLGGLYRHGAKINAAESAARAQGKKGWAAMKPALAKLPTKYKVATGIGFGGAVGQQVRAEQIRRRVHGE